MFNFVFFVRLLAIWGTILVVFTTFSVYQDIKQNKLLNYTDTYSSSSVDIKSEYKSSGILKYVFKFLAHDDYLGTMTFKYFRLRENQGQVIFRIKEISQKDWYAENRYDFSYFVNDDIYQFGFPEIKNSKGKQFIVEFEIVSQTLMKDQRSLDLKTAPILTVKYVFPRDTYYKSVGKLSTIVLNRSISVLTEMDYVKVFISSFLIAMFFLIALSRQENETGPKIIIRQKVLQKNVQILSNWTNKINPFIVPGVVLIILSLGFVSGNYVLAERMSVQLWATLFGSVVFYILQVTIFNRLSNLIKHINTISANTLSILDDLMNKKLLLLMGTLFVIVSGMSATYYLGGDDSRLFYLYPQEFLDNYISKIVSDTGVSQLTNLIPPTSLSAFTIIMIGLRNILYQFNLQALLNSANLVGGFFAFYYLLNYLLKPTDKYERVICVLASFMYVFSIFNFYTLLNSRLIAEYLISLFPLSLYLGIKAIREGKFYLFILATLIWSAFSFLSVTLPLSGAVLITSIPLLIFATWKHKIRIIAYLVGAGLLFAVLNLHWFMFIPYTNFSKNIPGSYTPSLTSVEFRKQNEIGIRTVSDINNSFFPLLNSYHRKIQINFNWPHLPIYLSWYSKILILGYLLIAVVIIAGIRIEKNKQRKGIYVALVINFVLAVYFFTVNIGPWGVDVFLWLSNHIPGFVIFRNMFDKFAYAMAFQWAFLISVSLIVIVKSIKKTMFKEYLLFAIFLIAIINAKPFLLREFVNLPYWTSKYSHDGITAFNSDYLDLLKFVKNQDGVGRYLSLPLLTGNSVIVEGEKQKDHYYAGVSPLLLLTGKNDMSGLMSFGEHSNKVFKWLTKKDYDSFGQLLQQYNVKYIILSNSTSEDLQPSFMFSDGLFYLQTKSFYQSIIGQKVRDFGSRYSLFEINSKYLSEKIYITDSPGSFVNQEANLSFKKLATHEYEIEVSDLRKQLSLVFLDPYLKEWQLLTPSGKELSTEYHHPVFGYANLWEINPQIIQIDFPKSDYQIMSDGSLKLKLKLYFQPYNYFWTVNIISASAYALGIAYVLLSIFIKFIKKQK